MLWHHPERSEGSHWFLRSAQDKLRLTPQNDILEQPFPSLRKARVYDKYERNIDKNIRQF